MNHLEESDKQPPPEAPPAAEARPNPAFPTSLTIRPRATPQRAEEEQDQ